MDIQKIVDNRDWNELSHSFGKATDTPKHLIGLINGDAATVRHAISELYGTIVHQGGFSSAGLAAVPILFEFLEHEVNAPKAIIVRLLLSIGIGIDSDLLLGRWTLLTNFSELGITKCKTPSDANLLSSNLIRACYEEVRVGVPTFDQLLNCNDEETRIQAAYTQSWFPFDNDIGYGILCNRLSENLTSSCLRDLELANLVLSFGLMQVHRPKGFILVDIIRKWLKHETTLIRYASAIYLSWHEIAERSKCEIVCSTLNEIGENEDFGCNVDVAFCSGFLSQFAETQLERVENAAT